MWALLSTAKNYLTKFSVTAMLREQLALSEAKASKLEAENAQLKAEVASLKAELKLTKEALEKEKAEHRNLQKEHEERVALLCGVEFRKGARTVGRWLPFCPKCHVVLHIEDDFGGKFICPGGCGWSSPLAWRDLDLLLRKENGE